VPYERAVLAKRPKQAGQTADKVLIELPEHTILAPSNGSVHPSGRPYIRLSGGFPTIATVSAGERHALVALARSFDEMPEGARKTVGAAPGKSEGNRPGDEFNRRACWGEILHGWTEVYTRGETIYIRRPGKREGISATINHSGHDTLYVFTSSTAFEPDTSYSKFAAYAVLEHGGDFGRAAAALAAAGHGGPNVRTAIPPRAPPGPHRRRTHASWRRCPTCSHGSAHSLRRAGSCAT
jgi:putative DNA primase/helicase